MIILGTSLGPIRDVWPTAPGARATVAKLRAKAARARTATIKDRSVGLLTNRAEPNFYSARFVKNFSTCARARARARCEL